MQCKLHRNLQQSAAETKDETEVLFLKKSQYNLQLPAPPRQHISYTIKIVRDNASVSV